MAFWPSLSMVILDLLRVINIVFVYGNMSYINGESLGIDKASCRLEPPYLLDVKSPIIQLSQVVTIIHKQRL